ncbi:MAG TPA: TIGR02328 family protein [Desulfosporosinus sp.]
MRLWHQDLLALLPRAQILGQHRECCALRGMGWGRKHSTVDYVFTHNVKRLVDYHHLVLREMEHRGYRPDPLWYCPEYRGKNTSPWPGVLLCGSKSSEALIYPEHDNAYREQCLANLRKKGVELFS